MTDEELKKYADEHWISVVFCYECKHLHWSGKCHISICSMLDTNVSNTFWCGYGKRKR